MTSGSLAGFPVVDVTATLVDGSYHEVDSSALAFQIAARGAFRDAMSKCGARLLEPVMKVRPTPPALLSFARNVVSLKAFQQAFLVAFWLQAWQAGAAVVLSLFEFF
jgi:hypothetical protein